MRIYFERGKQRELIKEFKRISGLKWNELANFLKIKTGTLKSYYYESSLIPGALYKKLDKNTNYKKFILEKKSENWGKKKGGSISKGNTKEIEIPGRSERLAEFYGVMLGDGNVTKISGYKIGVYSIRIVGDFNNEREYILNFVKPLVENLFKINVKVGKYKSSNCIFAEAYSRRLVDFLEGMGFIAGDKIRNRLRIPVWIKENKAYVTACLRGLFDTDGSFYRLGKQNSYQIQFKNHNRSLLDDVRAEILKLGIKVSKIIDGRSIVITKREEIEKFYKVVGFSNFKHLKKIKALIVPSSSGQIS